MKVKDIIWKGMTCDTLHEIRVREAEANEKVGKRSTCSNGVRGAAGLTLVNEKDRFRSGCAVSDDCDYQLAANFQHEADKW